MARILQVPDDCTIQQKDSGMTERVASLTAILLAAALIVSFFGAGGLLILITVDASQTSESYPSETPAALATLMIAIFLAALAAAILYRRKARRAAARGLAIVVGFLFALAVGELLCRRVAPSWPARDLHGVSPEKWAAAIAGDRSASAAVSLNSWGQRDRERSLLPPAGVRRIAFIGDSFLEEGAAVPVSLQTEHMIGRSDVEVVNLGVSATGPDEYYDRLRGVALPLGVSHCCLFIFAGNDFVSPERTLASFGGIAAVEPRPSLLTSLECGAWNHLLTNNRRPVIEAWMSGATLSRDEQERHRILRQATNDQIRQMLLQATGLDPASRDRLSSRLVRDDIGGLFDIFRDPDDGKFRSYYLSAALVAASSADWKWERNSDEIAWQWTERAARLCRCRKIPLTVVIIPEAFQVDDRMCEQWLPLADMRRCTAACRDAARTFVDRARANSLDVIDLSDELQGTRGTYLNLDGHWSAAGVELVAGVLAKHLAAAGTQSREALHESR
jgi:hypothetical protein